MMQKLHFHRLATFFVAIAALSVFKANAQYSEALVNSEYRDIILKQLQHSVEQRETTLRNTVHDYLLALPNDRKLYDESKMTVKANLESGITNDGLRELNYKFSISYSCHNFESLTDNYPTGKYLCEHSNASMALVELARTMIDEISSDAFKEGKKVDIKIKASTDITPVTQLSYNGEYGDFQYEAARYNGESVRISVSQQSGISTNAQLAFLRAQGIKHNLNKASSLIKKTDNTFSFDTRSHSEAGIQYRDVGIEVVVHGAFDEEIVEMNERLINDEFVDYNIPKNAENSNAKTYALIIANERYGAPLPNVPHAYNDGEVLQQYCIRTLGIPSRHVKIIEDATIGDIRKEGVDWMKDIAKASKGDCSFIIYFAGHGFSDYDHNPYLAPAGINYRRIKALRGVSNIDTERRLSCRDTKKLLKQCLRVDTLCAWFNRVPFQSATVILDASFNDIQRDGTRLINIKHSESKPKGLRIRNNIIVVAAAAFDKTAFAFDEQHHGFFTYFLLKELKKTKGNADYGTFFSSIRNELEEESSLQGLLQESVVYVGGKLKDNWTTQRLMGN